MAVNRQVSMAIKMLPLPQLLDGLGRNRVEVVQKALSLHLKAFRYTFARNFEDDADAEDHMSRMAILFETILNHVTKTELYTPFTQDILKLTLNHISALLQELQNSSHGSTLDQNKRAVQELLEFHGNQLKDLKTHSAVDKSLSKKAEKHQKHKLVTTAHVHATSSQSLYLGRWSSKSDEEMIREALLDPDAVMYAKHILQSRRGCTKDEVLECFISVADCLVTELLQKRQIEVAKDVLRNTDRDIWIALKSICLNTTDSAVRDYLALELNTIKQMDPSDVDLWKFLILIEGVLKNTSLALKVCNSKLIVISADKEKLDDDSNLRSVSIAVLAALPSDGDWKADVTLQVYLETLDGTLEPMLEKTKTWEYLLCHNRVDILSVWVQSVYEGKDIASSRLTSLFSSWEVTQEMVDYVEEAYCNQETRDDILNFLSRFHVYTTGESSDSRKRLLRIVRSGQLEDKTVENFKDYLVELSARHNLPELLVGCKINVDEGISPMLDLYRYFQQLDLSRNDTKDILKCIEVTSDFLGQTTTDECVALAPFILISDSKENFENVQDEPLGDDCSTQNETLGKPKEELLHLLAPFPRLLALETMPAEEQFKQDITVHDLLKDVFDADFNRIFHHQSSSSTGQEGSKTLLHFSSEELISQYGHRESLDYHYYLKQGRPSFAASLVLVEQYLTFGRLSRKMLKRACLSAHGLALCHFTKRIVTGSCISFIEMLGSSSLTLRTHIAVANNILAGEKISGNDAQKSEEKIKLVLQAVAIGEQEKGASDLLNLLRNNLQPDIVAQGLAVRLANIHRLPLPLGFLRHCAERNDWMSFLLYSQIYGYPCKEVKLAAKYFKAPSLRFHFDMLMNRVMAANKSFPSKITPGTSRQHYYSRIFKHDTSHGTRPKRPSSTPQPQHSGEQESQSNKPSTDTHSEDINDFDDLFGVLLVCHKDDDPSTALLNASLDLPSPILSVLSSCYQAHPELQLCTWLSSWLSFEIRFKIKECLKLKMFVLQDVELIMMESLAVGNVKLIAEGFRIFLPEHALAFVAFALEDCLRKKMFDNAMTLFEKFREMCKEMKNDSEEKDSPKLLPYFHSQECVYSLGTRMILKSLECSAAEQCRFLQILCQMNLSCSLDGKNVDLSVLLSVLNVLSETEVCLNVSAWFRDNTTEAVRCIDYLVSRKKFQHALDIASSVGVKRDQIVISELTNKLQMCLATSYQDFQTYCNDCNDYFEKTEVELETVLQFYQDCVLQLKNNFDKWLALHSAWLWMEKSCQSSDLDSSKRNQLERDMWVCCLEDDSTSVLHLLKDLKATPLHKLHCDGLGISSLQGNECFSTISEVQTHRLQELVNHLLDIGDLNSVLSIRRLFGFQHSDLKILEASLCLVEEKLSPEEIPAFVTEGSPPQRFRCYSSAGPDEDTDLLSSTQSDFVEIPSPLKTKTLSVVQALCDGLAHGKQLGKQITTCYQLAINLGLSYQEVATVVDPLKLLRTALSEACWNHYSVAADVITALKLSPEETADFLSREIIAAISKSCSLSDFQDCVMWGYNMESNFHRLLELAPDPTLLGNKLMNMGSKIVTTEKSTPKEVLITAVELLIRAHDCYTAACHMEGIASVLRAAHSLTNTLHTRSEWALMVRLLAGIQRYTEMSYIFKILKENDQFEFLLRKDKVTKDNPKFKFILRKDSNKPASMKTALLEWLRKERPYDPALLKMTAAHFKMHKEEAALWESGGKERLETLVAKGLQNNSATKSSLQTVLQDFSHAAECYLQANMLNHAMASAHQAELIALQLHLLSSCSAPDQPVPCVLLLDAKSVSKLVISELSFPQAQIVSRAYNQRIEWGAALFHHCVVSPSPSSAEAYFSAWSASMDLTPSLIQDVAQRFQRTQVITREMSVNMRSLLAHVQDMDVRYRVASELGFKDFVESLLQAPEVVYLKDTVWQRGFQM